MSCLRKVAPSHIRLAATLTLTLRSNVRIFNSEWTKSCDPLLIRVEPDNRKLLLNCKKNHKQFCTR